MYGMEFTVFQEQRKPCWTEKQCGIACPLWTNRTNKRARTRCTALQSSCGTFDSLAGLYYTFLKRATGHFYLVVCATIPVRPLLFHYCLSQRFVLHQCFFAKLIVVVQQCTHCSTVGFGSITVGPYFRN